MEKYKILEGQEDIEKDDKIIEITMTEERTGRTKISRLKKIKESAEAELAEIEKLFK